MLEQNNQLGGCLQVFSREKRVFDTGVHYIGGLDEGQNLDQYFRYFGIRDKLNVMKLDEDGFDRIHFGEEPEHFNYAQGYERFIATLSNQFPKEQSAIKEYCRSMQDICDRFPLYNLKPELVNYREDEMVSVNAAKYMESLTSDRMLAQVFGGSNLLYAGIKEKTPFYLHALVVNSYIQSAYRMVGGGSQIATNLARNIRAQGGVIRKRAKVTKLEMGVDGLVKHIVLSDGETIKAKKYISNLHPVTTINLLGDGKFRKAFENRMRGLANTTSSFTAHLVLKPGALPYMNYNIYHFDKKDVWNVAVGRNDLDWPNAYFVSSSPNKKDMEYCDTLSVLTYMDYNDMAPWMNSVNTVTEPGERDSSYEEFKQEMIERMIKKLELSIPGVSSMIESSYASTPLTYRDYIGSPDGNMYGFQKDHNSYISTYLNARTKIPNLFFTGQNLNIHGILGVTVSSFITCFELIDRTKLMKKVVES